MKSLLLAACALVALGTTAQAAVLTYTDAIISTATDWTSTLSVPKFNPALGTLTNINITLTGTVLGNVMVESMSASPANVTTNLAASLTLTRPDSTTLLVSFPAFTATQAFTAYDGTLDFAGTSGITYAAINSSQTAFVSTPPPATDLSLFTGSGTISLPISAHGASSVTGSGNLVAGFQTRAAAMLQIDYIYDAIAVPEPTALALLGLGVIGAGMRRRRRA